MSLVGRLEDLSLSDIFQILSVGRKTGTFIVSGSKGTAVIVFKNGLIVRAETSDLDKSLGDYLFDAGLVKDTVLNMALEVKRELPEKTVAEILYDFGSVTRESVEKVTRKRIERVICKLLIWEDGDFRFEPDDLDVDGKTDLPDLGWELSKGLSPEYLLMEGARVYDESSQSNSLSADDLSIEDTEETTGWDEDWSEQPPVERKDIHALRSLTQELRFPNSASEITLLILRFASDIFERGVLFMVGRSEIVGLGQFGLDIEHADKKVREIVLNPDNSEFLQRIIFEQMPFKGQMERDMVTERLKQSLLGDWPSEIAIFPIIAEGKVVGILYCDNMTTGNELEETEGLEIFISHAGLALEKSLLQRRLHEIERRKESS